jgi:hypothetical protein
LLVACGASQREKTIRSTFAAANIAADSLVGFARAREEAIFEAGTSKEAVEADIKAFRSKVDHVERAIAAVWRMTAAAAIANDEPSLSALLKIAGVLWTELKELGVKVPPL